MNKPSTSAILELASIFKHQVAGRKIQALLKEFTLALDKGMGKVKWGQFWDKSRGVHEEGLALLGSLQAAVLKAHV